MEGDALRSRPCTPKAHDQAAGTRTLPRNAAGPPVYGPPAAFPRAEAYASCFRRRPLAVREGGPSAGSFAYTERHLQCVWFDPAYRPADLRTDRGERVTVSAPGRWNLEAGPDFLDAAITLEPERRMMRGDVEVHVRPADWRDHRHTADPRYGRVIAHVTYFADAASPARSRAGGGGPPPGVVRIALRDALRTSASFRFEDIDVAAYPHAARIPAPPCAPILAAWGPDRVTALLEAAGEERLRIKSQRIRAALGELGAEQTLYEEIMGALGYKHNRVAFRRLARAVPVADLRAESARDALRAYALLLGVSGLLPDEASAADAETRRFVRALWDHWWKLRGGWAETAMPRSAWRLSNLRPQNHPLRRLASAATLFAPAGELAPRVVPPGADAETCLRHASAVIAGARPLDYWRHRLALGGKVQPAESALVGAARLGAITTNVLVPLLAALDRPVAALLRLLPAEEDNSLIRQTAATLLGRDHNPALYRHGLQQQGLLQIFHDFCLGNRTTCADCQFAESLARFTP
jgi:hypothetical protein